MLARCGLWLFEFDLDIVHSAGIENQAVDSLTRLITEFEDNTAINNDNSVAIIALSEDRNEATKILTYTVRHICDHNHHSPGKMIHDVQGLVGQEYLKWYRLPMLV